MERLTNKNHKELGFCAYVGTQNPFKAPLTIGELAGFLNVDYSPRKILEDILGRLAAYEDTGLAPEEILTGKELAEVACVMNLLKEYQAIGPIDHMHELAQAEKDGRLVVLPCKIGDTVWTESPVKGMVYSFEAPDIAWIIESADQFGKEIFLTREEAEAALKKREDDNEAD